MDARPYNPSTLIPSPFLRSATPGVVASANERAVLRQIWDNPGVSRAALIGALDITQQSLHRIVEHLVARGLVRLGAPRAGTGRGQPSPTLYLDPSWGFTAGISINTDRAGLTAMSLDGARLTRSIDIAGIGREVALDRLEEALTQMIAEMGQSRQRLFGIGFGISGFRMEGTQFNPPEPLASWALIELGPLLSERFGAPVWTDNGANLAAITEAMLGVGRHTPDFAYLSFNYGFGGAVIVDGQILAGARGNAGEFSAMFNHDDMAVRPALRLLLNTLAEHGIEIATIAELKDRFDPSWPGVAGWIDMVMPQVNRLLNALSAITDPELIVFGGEIPRALAEAMIARAELWSSPRHGVARKVPGLVISELRNEPASIGGASLPLMSCLL